MSDTADKPWTTGAETVGSQGSHTAPERTWHIGQGLPCGCHMRADKSRQVIDIQACTEGHALEIWMRLDEWLDPELQDAHIAALEQERDEYDRKDRIKTREINLLTEADARLREAIREIAERIRETTDAGEYIGAQFATMAVSTMREWADALDRLTEGENDAND